VIIQEEQIDLSTPLGLMRTYVYRPVAGGKYPGVVFFSEIFQQTGPIKRSAMFLAGQGYVVAVPEIFHELNPLGTVLPYDKAGTDKGNSDKIAKTLQSYDDDCAAVLLHLRQHPACTGTVGAIGICIGGHLAFRAAMHEGVRASACFYATDIHKRSLGKGMNDNSLDRIPEIKGELLMIWGRQDPHIPAEGRALLYQRLTEANTTFTWHEFNGQHAFMRDEGHRYDPELSALCWQLVLALFSRRLRDGDGAFSNVPKGPAHSACC
jgi:carboxymethylenebutenolidase